MHKRISALLIALLLIAMMAPAALAEDTAALAGEKQLTLQQAYELALKNNNSLKQAELAVDRALEVKDFRHDYVTYIPSGGSTSPEAAAIYTTAVMADMGYQMAKRSLTVAEDTLYLDVLDKYNDLLAAQEKLDYNQKSLSNAQMQKKIDELSLALGTTSSIEYGIGHSAYETAKLEVQNAQTALDKAYTDFNNLVGLNVSERPVLLDRPAFEPLEVDNLDNAISRILNQDASIWMQEQKVDLAALKLDLYSGLDPSSDPYEAQKIDVETAELSASGTRSQMAHLLRTMHNSMQQLEEGYLIKEQVAKIAEQTLTLKQLMFDVGMLSQVELSKAQLEAEKASLDRDQTAYQYAYYKLAFEKPWAYINSMNSN